MADITRGALFEVLNRIYTLFRGTGSGLVEIGQPVHDNLNCNANIQVGDSDVSESNPIPIENVGGESSSSGSTSTILVGVDVGSYTFDASGQTVTFSGLGTVNLEQVLSIINVTDNITIYSPTNPDTGGSMSTNVLTLTYDTTSMSDTDDLQVIIHYNNSEDFSNNLVKTQEQSPLWGRYTDSEELVSASDIGAVDDTWIDQGAEIDCRGYNTITIWVNLTVNNSTGNQLQVLSKHESGGADEYIMETATDYQKTIGNSSVKIRYDLEVDNTTPYIQIQTKATVVGATEGTVTIHITKGYK